MAVVKLGHADGRVTTATIPLTRTFREAVRDIIHADGVWRAHSGDPSPAWVESDNEQLATAISEHFSCPVGQPE
jgi:hypothetical protein